MIFVRFISNSKLFIYVVYFFILYNEYKEANVRVGSIDRK